MSLVRVPDFPSNETRSTESFSQDSSNELAGFLSYSYICGAGSSAKTRLIEIPENRLKSMLTVVLNLVNVDEAWYLTTNPDVDHAVKSGDLPSARAHYQIAGFFEDRWPYRIEVDEIWYQTEYPDVKTAIARGGVESCQDHFNRFGFREGRRPSMGWSLLTARPSDA